MQGSLFALEKCLNLQGYYQTQSTTYAVSKSTSFYFSKWNVRNEVCKWHLETIAVLVFPGRMTELQGPWAFPEGNLKDAKTLHCVGAW